MCPSTQTSELNVTSANSIHQNQTVPKETSNVPLSKRVAWGMGGLADNYMMNALNQLVTPVYTIALKLDPFLAGLAMLLPRLVDALTDPLMGNISDNTRSRWGTTTPLHSWRHCRNSDFAPIIMVTSVTNRLGDVYLLYGHGFNLFDCLHRFHRAIYGHGL